MTDPAKIAAIAEITMGVIAKAVTIYNASQNGNLTSEDYLKLIDDLDDAQAEVKAKLVILQSGE